MNKINCLAWSLLLCGLMLESCMSEDDFSRQSGQIGMRLVATVEESSSTRSLFEFSDSSWRFLFEGFDQVCVTNRTTGPNGYIFTRGYDGDFVSSLARPTENASDWFAFYPLFSVAGSGSIVLPPGMEDEENDYSGGYMDLTEQSGTREGISKYYVMSGKMADVAAGTSELTFAMKPAVAILRLGNYDGPKHLMIKFDEDTYWDGRLYVADYSSNCDFFAGETVYQTTVCYLPGNGVYYVAVPAGRKLYLTDEFDNQIKTTKDCGLSAGKYYNVNVSPITTSHVLQVAMENNPIMSLLQENGLGDWNEGSQLRFFNTIGGSFEYEYKSDIQAFVSTSAKAASGTSSWNCIYPMGDADNGTISYNLSGQSGGITDFSRKYHLMYGQEGDVPGGIIPSQMGISSQTALLVVNNTSGDWKLGFKLPDGTYWDGHLSASVDETGRYVLTMGHSDAPVQICRAGQAGNFYLSIPPCDGLLCDMEGKELSSRKTFAKGERYDITLESETEIIGEESFTIYVATTEWNQLFVNFGMEDWKEGDEVRLCNLAGSDYTLCRQKGVFVSNEELRSATVATTWMALYPKGTPSPEGGWDFDLTQQSGTLEDFRAKYCLGCGLKTGMPAHTLPMWATLGSKVGMLEIRNNSRYDYDIVLRETVNGKYWDGHIRIDYNAASESTNVNWSSDGAVICSIRAGETAYLAVPQGRFRIYDKNGDELLARPVDILYGQMKNVLLP